MSSEGESERTPEYDGEEKTRLSRGQFLAAAGAAGLVVGGGVGAGIALGLTDGEEEAVAGVPDSWGREADVVVVGSGAAAFAAALAAEGEGAEVVMLEKASQHGGTSAKSGGVYWIPNNSLLREKGMEDPREDAIRYMCRCSFPAIYDPDDARFGLADLEYSLIEAYYDTAAEAIDALQKTGALTSGIDAYMEFPDYYAHLPEDKLPNGRHMSPVDSSGTPGAGSELIKQMKAAADKRAIPLLVSHRVARLIMNGAGEVVGVEADNDGKTVTVRARKAVVFGSGGFTHNRALALHALRGPIFGGCGVPTNTGDFVAIATAAGADLGNMNNAWWAQIVLELALESTSVPTDIWSPPGDSMVEVNRFGRRVVNEKSQYNERTQAHFVWDPVRGEYPNLVLFMVYDDRTAREFAGKDPVPGEGTTAPYVVSGGDLDELGRNIDARLDELSGRPGSAARVLRDFRLAPDFVANLRETFDRYNGFARSGKELDFNRGEQPIDLYFHTAFGGGVRHDMPNPTMYPISERGPYHCILLGGGTLDTKGGPKTNPKAQVIDAHGRAIPGLYGAGNCVAGAAGQAYWSGGGTLGPALTFGHIAGKNAAAEAVKTV
jgi:3-oxosteroid 1-dehydrogenase